MITGESVDSSPRTPPPLPPEPPTPKPNRLHWVRLLLAPLLVLSVVGHLALLFIPLPSPPVAEVEEEEPEEEFVDLLSISSLPSSEPEPEPDVANTPPPEAAPPAAAAAPTAPTQPVVPQAFPDTPPPEAAPLDAPPDAEPDFTQEPPAPAAAFAQSEEAEATITRLTRGGGSDFDITAAAFPGGAFDVPRGIGTWTPEEQGCFFTRITANDYQLLPNAASVRFLSRNIQLIERDDIPRTFPAPEYQTIPVDGGYCGRPLFQILRAGQPYIFLSIAGVGVGNPQSTGLVIIWSSDPRG